MSKRGTLIFYVSVYVSASLCFCQPMFPSPYVSVRLYPCLSASLLVCTPSVCTLNTVAHRALFHRSLSTYSVLFVLLACPVLSFFPLSFHSSSSSFSLSLYFFFFFFSDIFSSYSPDSSCSSRDTPFSVKKPVSRACSAKLRRTTCSDTPF